jgi:hypothetical protein
MMRSGSTSSMNSRQRTSKSASFLNSMTSVPTMWEQVLRVKTLRMKGLVSPVGVREHRRRDGEREVRWLSAPSSFRSKHLETHPAS